MNDTDVRDLLARVADEVPATPPDPEPLLRRGYGRMARTAVAVALAAAAIAMATFAGFDAIRSAPIPADRPTPKPGVTRAHGEVLSFTGTPSEAPGDLVAVNPETGEARVLVEGIDVLRNARWSADGRWVAYDVGDTGSGLWVVNAELKPRQLTSDESFGSWAWSPTDAQLAMVRRSTLMVIDAATGGQTDLGDVVGDVTSAPVWSPDGKQILLGARGGSLYSVDVQSGERSLFVRLPGEDLDSMDEIEWSPDGAHLAVVNDLDEPGGGRLYVMDADGSRVHVLVEDFERGSNVVWSPDGTRLTYLDFSGPDERELSIWTVSLDGSTPSLVGSHTFRDCPIDGCGTLWSLDGSQIAFETGFETGDRSRFVINADGTGRARPIDELAYLSWGDGSYFCECYG